MICIIIMYLTKRAGLGLFKGIIYNFILEYRLPVSRKDKTVREFLKIYFSDYVTAYKKALLRTDSCTLREEQFTILQKV